MRKRSGGWHQAFIGGVSRSLRLKPSLPDSSTAPVAIVGFMVHSREVDYVSGLPIASPLIEGSIMCGYMKYSTTWRQMTCCLSPSQGFSLVQGAGLGVELR
jgi:hypothetical protein